MNLRCIAFAAACALLTNGLFAKSPDGPLFERLGGKAVVTAFVSDTFDKVAADPQAWRALDNMNLQHAKHVWVERICFLTGGGCAYTSDPMRAAHAGQWIGDPGFSGLIEVLRESMRGHDVPLAARNELLEILAPASGTQ